MYKFYNKLLPPQFNQMFTLNSDLHAYNTRQSALYHLPPARTTLMLKSFTCEFPVLWNNLTPEIQRSTTLSRFKNLSRKTLFQNLQ